MQCSRERKLGLNTLGPYDEYTITTLDISIHDHCNYSIKQLHILYEAQELSLGK